MKNIALLLVLLFSFGCQDTFMSYTEYANSQNENLRIMALEPETVAYRSKLIANGGTHGSPIDAVDKFVKSAKANGYWDKIHEISLFCGLSLNGGLVKLKSGINAPTSLINYNHTAADFSQYYKGIGPTEVSNNSKYLSTGFKPSDAGINTTNGSFGLFLLDSERLNTESKYTIMGVDAPVIPTAEGFIYLGGYFMGAGNYNVTKAKSGVNMMSILYRGDTTSNFMESIRNGFKTNVQSISFDATVTFFRPERYSGTAYTRGKIGAYYIAKDLTVDQQQLLDKAIMDFNKSMSRAYSKPLAVWLGNSNTAGISADTDPRGIDIFSKLVSNGLNVTEVNSGTAGAKLLTDHISGGNEGSYLAMHKKVAQIIKLAPKYVFITAMENDANNDGATNGNPTTIASGKAKLKEIALLLKSKGIIVTIVSLPHYTTGTLQKRLNYVQAQREAALEAGVKFADIHTVTEGMCDPFHLYKIGHSTAANKILSVQ